MKQFIYACSIFAIRFIPLLCLLALGRPCFADPVRIAGLSCEGFQNPIGLDNSNPLFSWKMDGTGAGSLQQAYQVLVASSPARLNLQDADLWNSGKVASGNAQWVRFAGKPLVSKKKYYWKVLVWTGSSTSALESNPAFFTMGLLRKEDWTAKWIGLDTFYSWDRPKDLHSQLSARYFRMTFVRNAKPIRNACLYFTGLGLYQLFINGQRIGMQELSPSVTDFTRRVYYNVFDLTKQLSALKNTFGIVLGNGRFFSLRPGEPGKWKEGIPSIRNFGYPRLIFQLEIEYTDGTHETVVSDSSWKVTADGPVRSNNEYDGEVYDPNKEMPGWNKNDFNARQWIPASDTHAPGGLLIRQPNPNMKIMSVLKPVSIQKTGARRFLVDLGQNMVGWVALKTQRIPHLPIVLRYAERLKDSTTLYTDNLRSARVRDSIAASAQPGLVSWHPSFVYHGFRYIEITGVDNLKKEDIEGQVIYDEMATTGSFQCSEPILNQIYKAAYWTIMGNYKGLPVDCPQRDERMGWLGDRSVNSFGESFIFDNYFVYSKWLDDIADAQLEDGSIPDVAPSFWHPFLSDNMTWPSSYLFVSEMLYRQFGDKNIVVRHYPGMKRWMAHMKTFFTADSLIDRDNYGDWCMPPESKELILSQDSTRQTPKGFIASSYYIGCLKMMEEFAIFSGHPEDSTAYEKLRVTMVTAINKKYFNTAGGYYANNTITSNLLALAFDIVPASGRAAVAANIVKVSADKFDNHLGTGLVGNQWLMRGLTDNGYADVAFRIATNTTYPSWGYMIGSGSTTIWELWNGNTANPAMNSGNHVMLLGDLMIWYYERLAGIKPIDPGFKRIEMRPLIENRLSYVEAQHTSPYGKIKSRWTHEQSAFTWDITIPGNSTALVHVPAASRETVQFTQNGSAPGKYLGKEDGYFIFELLPGHYAITSVL